MRGIFLAMLFALVPTMGIAQQDSFLKTAPGEEAWWLRTEFHALDTEVRGIPVARIRANWCKATEFRKDLFPRDLAADFPDKGSPFAVDGFFDGSKIPQTALTGVYETCKGQRGAFFLVVAQPKGKPASVRCVVEIEGEREFAMVETEDDSTVAVYHCMECDHISKFKWNRKKRGFVLLPPDKDE